MGLAERIDAHLAWPSKPKGLFAAFNNPDGPPWLKQMVENFSLQKDFTPEEARFVLKGRLHHIFSSLQFNISRSAILDSYMRHAGGSSTVWARHYGLVQTSTNLANLLLAPVVGCLSDTIGRKPLMIFGRIGWTAWWLIVANVEAISARTGMTVSRHDIAALDGILPKMAAISLRTGAQHPAHRRGAVLGRLLGGQLERVHRGAGRPVRHAAGADGEGGHHGR